MRDALAATLGTDSIKYLSSAVFVVMLGIVQLFGWLFTRLPRPRLVRVLYGFFIINISLFALAFQRLAGYSRPPGGRGHFMSGSRS